VVREIADCLSPAPPRVFDKVFLSGQRSVFVDFLRCDPGSYNAIAIDIERISLLHVTISKLDGSDGHTFRRNTRHEVAAVHVPGYRHPF